MKDVALVRVKEAVRKEDRVQRNDDDTSLAKKIMIDMRIDVKNRGKENAKDLVRVIGKKNYFFKKYFNLIPNKNSQGS